jgi:hypothetical protein
MTAEYRPRVMIDVSQQLLDRINTVIPFGTRSKFYEAILEDMVALVEERGAIVVALMLERKLHVKDVSPTLKEGLHET